MLSGINLHHNSIQKVVKLHKFQLVLRVQELSILKDQLQKLLRLQFNLLSLMGRLINLVLNLRIILQIYKILPTQLFQLLLWQRRNLNKVPTSGGFWTTRKVWALYWMKLWVGLSFWALNVDWDLILCLFELLRSVLLLWRLSSQRSCLNSP